MKLRFFGVLAVVLLAGLSPAAAQIPIPPGWQAERAVVLVRDGVYAPLQTELDSNVATPWPVWPVQPGFLTPHGAELMRLMGGYYRALQGGRGLTQTDDCPPAGTVAAWADNDQRSRETGAALLLGMYPRCANLAPRSQADLATPDPLFHPQPTASCPMDATSNRAALLARIGGDFSSVLREYAPQLSLMQATLCPPALAAGRARCGLSAEPPAVQAGPNGQLTMSGPIAIGSAAAEQLRHGERRRPARQPGGVGSPLGRRRRSRICSRSTGWKSTSSRRPRRLRSSAARTCSARSSRPCRTATNFPARPMSPSRCGWRS